MDMVMDMDMDKEETERTGATGEVLHSWREARVRWPLQVQVSLPWEPDTRRVWPQSHVLWIARG